MYGILISWKGVEPRYSLILLIKLFNCTKKQTKQKTALVWHFGRTGKTRFDAMSTVLRWKSNW